MWIHTSMLTELSVAKVCHHPSREQLFSHLHIYKRAVCTRSLTLSLSPVWTVQNMTATEIGTYYKVHAFHFSSFSSVSFSNFLCRTWPVPISSRTLLGKMSKCIWRTLLKPKHNHPLHLNTENELQTRHDTTSIIFNNENLINLPFSKTKFRTLIHIHTYTHTQAHQKTLTIVVLDEY